MASARKKLKRLKQKVSALEGLVAAYAAATLLVPYKETGQKLMAGQFSAALTQFRVDSRESFASPNVIAAIKPWLFLKGGKKVASWAGIRSPRFKGFRLW